MLVIYNYYRKSGAGMFNNLYQTWLFVAITALLLSSVSSVAAESAKPIAPINIDADNARVYEKEGKSIYTGNVVLIQANTKVTADKISVFSKDGKLSQIIAEGKPVTYHQNNKPKAADIKGQADKVYYFAFEKRIVLLNNAKLTQGKNTFSGNRIEYNANTEVVTAKQSKSGKERVRVTIQPETKSGNTNIPLP